MRVLHLAAGNLYGGVETLLVTLARQRQHCPEMEPVFALCFAGRLARELADSGVAVHSLGPVRLSRPWTVWRARKLLFALIEREPFDAVIAHGCWLHVLAAPVVSGRVPLVFWAHSPPGGGHWLERWAARTTPDLVIANSQFTRGALGRQFPGAPSEVVYLPVSPVELSDRAEIRAAVRAELATPADAVVIIQASRLEPLKGHHVLLAALRQLAGTGDHVAWSCWFAGGPQRASELGLAEALRRETRCGNLEHHVRWLGERHDVPRLLAAADVYCQPNVAPDSFGISFIESLYAGLPVVTSALGGALEIVTPECGILVPAGDSRRLAEVLRELIADARLRERLGRAGPTRAAALCDPPRQLRRLAEVLAPLGTPRGRQRMEAKALPASAAEKARPQVAFLVNASRDSALGQRARALGRLLKERFDFQVFYRSRFRLAATAAFLGRLLRLRPRTCYVFDMAYSGVLAAGLYKLLTRRPVVIETGDVISELAVALDRGFVGRWLTRLLERVSYRLADQIVVRGSYHQQALVDEGIPAELIPDGVQTDCFAPPEAERLPIGFGPGRELTVGFLGSSIWSKRRGVCAGWELVEVIRLLKDEPVRGLLVGSGSGIAVLQERCRQYGILDRVHFAGHVPYDELPAWLRQMDVCLLTLSNDAIGWARTSGKLPLYLAAGRYVLSSRVGEAARLLDDAMLVDYHGSVDPEYPGRLAERIRALLKQPAQLERGRDNVALARRRFDYSVLAERLGAVLDAVLARKSVA
jgi:glycosyltransferase involved in cell wall biosynthesis